MTIEIYNLQVLGRVLGKLNQVPDVIDLSDVAKLPDGGFALSGLETN
jgi:hypothetical protein